MDISVPIIATIIMMKYDTNNDINKNKKMAFSKRIAHTQKSVL